MTEKKTDPNNNANDMGGPSFHPDIEKTKNFTPKRDTMDKEQIKDDGAILDEDQVPPL